MTCGAGDGQSLRLDDLAVLLSDYRRLAHSGALPLPSLPEGSALENVGRFVHLAAADVRLGDLPHLLDSYRALLALS